MASQSNNRSGSQEIHKKPFHAPKTLGDRRAKLLVDAQRAAKVAFRQKLGWLLPEKGVRRDITIKCLQTQLLEMAQILVDNKLMKPTQVVEDGSSTDRTKGLNLPPRESQNKKQHRPHVSLDNRSDRKSTSSSK